MSAETPLNQTNKTKSRRPLVLALIAFIVLFWLVMSGLLVRKELFVPHFKPGELAAAAYSDVPQDLWMRVAMGDQTVGYINFNTHPGTRDADPGTRLSMLARMRMSMLGEETGMQITGSGWVSNEHGLTDVNIKVRSGSHAIELDATVDDGMLNAELVTGGETVPIQWPVGKDLFLWSGLGFTAGALPPLEVGQEFVIDTFDPVSLSVGPARIACTEMDTVTIGEETFEAHVLTIDQSGYMTKAWVTETGETLRAETPMGFSLQRVASYEATSAFAKMGSASDMLTKLAIVPTGKRPSRGAKHMTAKLSGLQAGIDIPSDDTQVWDGTGLLVIDTTSQRTTETDIDLETHLLSSALVQADHPTIQETAAEIVGDSETNKAKAQALYDWVYTSIEKVPTLSVPSALDVLENREGDCNEHTVLYTALARAVDVPTRMAIGVVWSDTLGGFYYHAWPEVRIDDRWVWMDPTLGQPQADATHIKLLAGDITQWTKLVAFLGQLQIEVVDIE